MPEGKVKRSYAKKPMARTRLYMRALDKVMKKVPENDREAIVSLWLQQERLERRMQKGTPGTVSRQADFNLDKRAEEKAAEMAQRLAEEDEEIAEAEREAIIQAEADKHLAIIERERAALRALPPSDAFRHLANSTKED